MPSAGSLRSAAETHAQKFRDVGHHDNSIRATANLASHDADAAAAATVSGADETVSTAQRQVHSAEVHAVTGKLDEVFWVGRA